jgi:hypothetical protein
LGGGGGKPLCDNSVLNSFVPEGVWSSDSAFKFQPRHTKDINAQEVGF